MAEKKGLMHYLHWSHPGNNDATCLSHAAEISNVGTYV